MRQLLVPALCVLLTACGDGEPVAPANAMLPDGGHYRGTLVDGLLQGQGRIDYPNGSSYQGTFEDGQWQGKGIWQSPDSERYNGAFKNDLFHGQGRYEDAEGNVWIGTFKAGELSGTGRYIGADGHRYQGQFKHWRYQGQGRLDRPNGSHESGRFRRGRLDGPGERVLADGSRESGYWRNGRRIRDEQGRFVPDPLELALLAQGRLLDDALAAVPASTPARELYTLTLAGDGRQSVFLREADYVNHLLAERFHARGQIVLVNHRDHLADRPMATRESLARAIRVLASRSGPEDLILLYFTSHGSEDHQLTLAQPRLALESLAAADLAQLLEPLAERNKVVIVSACYSGGFIAPLKDARTLVMTAARADRSSFGCSEESDFTYFGRALFAEALRQTDDLERAFRLTQAKVAEREQADHYQASEPQLWAPAEVLEHWRSLPRAKPTD